MAHAPLLRGAFVFAYRLAIVCCLFHIPSAQSKTVTGDFKLSGVNTEHVLTTFAVMPEGGRVEVRLSAKHGYDQSNPLLFRLFRDTDWPAYLRAMTCNEKKKYAMLSHPIVWEHNSEKSVWEATVSTFILNDMDGSSKRNHYWYFVIDDCSLEQYMQDHRVPKMHFTLTVRNQFPNKSFTHLSADEEHLARLHTVTLLLSGFYAIMLTFKIVTDIMHKKSVHAALLAVTAVAALDSSSSFFELMHLKLYEYDGIGSYSLDAMAAHCSALCDAMLVLLLLAISAGWTLPSDIISVNANASFLQDLLEGLSAPIGSLWRFNAAGMLALATIAVHVVLAQWGRTYDESFETYHDFEHLPGKILMGIRIILGCLFLVATLQTRIKCKAKPLKIFYLSLAMLGFAWFQSLPFLTWLCHVFVPYYLRNPAVFIGCAISQSTSIGLFAWLVTAHSTNYHTYSHISEPSEESLSDVPGNMHENSRPLRTWSLGKAKVRLD